MAYSLNDQQQNQENTQNQNLFPQISSGFGSVGPVQQPVQRPKNVGSGMFTNVQQLLNVNRAAGQSMAAKAGGFLTKDVTQTASGIEKVQDVHKQTQQEKKEFQEKADEISQAIQQSRTTQNHTALSNLTSDDNLDQSYRVVQGQTNLANLQQQFGQEAAGLTSGLRQVQGELEVGTGTEGGRFDLVRRAVKGPTYTRGQQGLDQLLMQGAGGEILRETLEQGRSTIGQTFGDLSNVTQEQIKLAQQYQELADQTRQNLTKLITETEELTQKQIEQREKEYLAQIEAYEKLSKDILSGNMSLSQLANWITSDPSKTDIPKEFSLFKKVQLDDKEVPTVYEYQELYDAYGVSTPAELQKAIFNFSTAKQIPEHVTKLYRKAASAVAARLGTTINFSNAAKFTEEIFRELAKTRKATQQDKAYQQALVDKFLRENFGIDTSTSLFGMDPASLINVNRSNLRERVRTQQETAQINALRKLAQGRQAEQLKTEGIGQSIADIVKLNAQKEAIQKKQAEEFENFLKKLGESGDISGHSQAGQHLGGGQWRNHYATVTINPVETFLKQNPQVGQVTTRSDRGGWLGDLTSSIGLGDSASDAQALARQRAHEAAMHQYRERIHSLGANRRIKFK